MVHEIESNDAEMCLEEPACFHGGVGTWHMRRIAAKTVHPLAFASSAMSKSVRLAADVHPDTMDGVAPL